MKTKWTLFLCLTFVFSLSAQINLDEGLIANYTFNQTDHFGNTMVDITERGNDITTYNIDFFDDDRFQNLGSAIMLDASYTPAPVYATLNEDQVYADFTTLDQFSLSFFNLILPTSYEIHGDYPLFSMEDETDKKLTIEIQSREDGLFYTLKLMDANALLFERDILYQFPEFFNWAHIGFSYDAVNGQAIFYVDGIPTSTINMSLPVLSNTQCFFGRSSTATASLTCFDDLFLYDRIINPEEFDALFTMDAITTHLDVLPDDQIKIFPVPSIHKLITIEISNASNPFEVQTFDQMGRLVDHQWIESGDQLDLSRLPEGVYHLNVLSEKRYSKKVILLDD